MDATAAFTSRTLTFLFTDIEGSTARWEERGPAMAAALARHDALLRAAIEERGGLVFKTVGDAFHAAFEDADAALVAAADAQRALAAEDWGAFGEGFGDLRVRMDIHLGKAEARDGDYFGPALNRTARLMSAGHGGQVLNWPRHPPRSGETGAGRMPLSGRRVPPAPAAGIAAVPAADGPLRALLRPLRGCVRARTRPLAAGGGRGRRPVPRLRRVGGRLCARALRGLPRRVPAGVQL